MMMNELYQRERHADFVRQAEQERIALEAQTEPRKPFYKPVLKTVGVNLVKLGNRLQDNVENAAPGPIFTTGSQV